MLSPPHDLHSLKYAEAGLWTSIWSVLENIPGALEKNLIVPVCSINAFLVSIQWWCSHLLFPYQFSA